MIGIVVAMPEEAEPIVKALNLYKNVAGLYTGMLKNESVVLAISGIGRSRAQNTAWKLICLGCDKMVNIGSCGDLGGYGIGGVVLPNIFYDGDFDLSDLGTTTKDPCLVNSKYLVTEKRMVPCTPVKCYTYSTFVSDARVSDCIVEMEAYGIAAACTEVGVPFIAIKIPSDCADESADENFQKNVEGGMELSVIAKNMDKIVDIISNYDDYYTNIYEMRELKED